MATYSFAGYDDDQINFPGGTPSTGENVTFTFASDHVIEITDNDTTLVDGTDDRDDEDSSQTAVIYDEFGSVETSGQIQPRHEAVLSDGTNTYVMMRVYIASSNSYYYIFEDPPPELNVEYTVTSVGTPNSTPYSNYSTVGVACFTRGTRLMTPDGPRAVDLIAPGDLVETCDNGPQPVRWIGRRAVSRAEMRARPNLAPVWVAADAFGPGQPGRDLMFSRQHRLLLDGDAVTRAFGVPEVLAPVHALDSGHTVRREMPPFGTEYLHLLFDRHEILIAEGLPTESLLLAEMVAELISTPEREELRRLFPALPAPNSTAMRPARPLVSRGQVDRFGLARSHARAS